MSLEKYTGHKKINGLFQKIINQIPKHLFYYELFAGSGAIASLMPVTDQKITLNDIDAEVHIKLKEKFPNAVIWNYETVGLIDSIARKNVCDFNDYFVFLDPPYHHSTRPKNTKLYNHEMTDLEHILLLNNVLKLNCKVMISHPKCDLYEKTLKDWRKVEVKERYHQKTQIVVLYMNYPEPKELQCYNYFGNDCWERQQMKRKLKGYTNKFSKMSVLEKNYILNELNKL